MSLHPDFLRVPIAHRALHDVADGRPENSLAAIRAAIASGYAIEIDLQPSSDGVPMVFHDYHLTRLTGQDGPIAQRSAAELAEIKLRGGDEGVPSLEQVLELVAGQVPLLIEIKDQDGALGPNVGGLGQASATLLRSYRGPLAVMSFNPHAIADFASAAPEICVGLTTCDYAPEDWPLIPEPRRAELRAIPDLERTGAGFISHQAEDLGAPRVSELAAQSLPILCWTIRSPDEESAARAIADNITFERYLAALPA
ncbi:phosphodiesterase [Thioclava sp. BHET1]|nr:phosphodiesterase [Thioclava sp. BHET1]